MMHNLKSPPYGHSSITPRMNFLKEPCGRDEMDIEFQIKSLEKEAYCSVLRAFIAQSDLLSWGKEGLLTELRKELNITDVEHSQLLVNISSDESTKRIRELRKGTHESVSTKVDAPGPIVTSVDDAPAKKRKPSLPPLSKSWKCISHDQPHLATIPPLAQTHIRGNQQHDEMSVLPPTVSLKIVNHNFKGPLSNKNRGPSQSHMKKSLHMSDAGKFKNCSDFIEIRATDMVIHEVNSLAYGRDNPDPVQVERAKLILREHERDIIRALEKLADMSDEDGLPNQLSFGYKELHGNRHEMLTSNDLHDYFNHGY